MSLGFISDEVEDTADSAAESYRYSGRANVRGAPFGGTKTKPDGIQAICTTCREIVYLALDENKKGAKQLVAFDHVESKLGNFTLMKEGTWHAKPWHAGRYREHKCRDDS